MVDDSCTYSLISCSPIFWAQHRWYSLVFFQVSILSDPFRVLQSWNYYDETPCSWNGVTCGAPGIDATFSRVTGLSLPNAQLLGSIPAELGMVQYLQNLDLSNNSLNGSLPFALFNASQLRFLDLSNNMISGELPETIGSLQNLEFLNLSENALAGTLPSSLPTLHNLSVVSLNNNYFFGGLPSEFGAVQVLDLSFNLINGSLLKILVKSRKSRPQEQEQHKGGTLATFDGENSSSSKLYSRHQLIYWRTGSSIMYKAVLEDGTALAVRRIGKVGSSPCYLPWEVRLKISKGVARGLSFLHDKKHVHGNLKPSNILLGSDMEPRIGILLERLMTGDSSRKSGGSTRNFGSKRSTASRIASKTSHLGPAQAQVRV
ncbi:hypothetical protein GH714_032711 [Hevea brasiliensis]|uniref:Leucine-rich repeat-containing N-terminal plant-type domain-containing protein n=1 Tax=Hevea brasiliensis TaxID=3981 RepID=A0A6A6L1W7_HEVBR|nr:hypothetical protein GH714_032711 [Hevea brasiliensis]